MVTLTETEKYRKDLYNFWINLAKLHVREFERYSKSF